jgi:hypothetical protein
MGDVIRRNAKAEDIFVDIATTLLRAQARGGKWQAIAEGQLGEAARLIGEMRARREAAIKALEERRAAAGAGLERAARVVGKVADGCGTRSGGPRVMPPCRCCFRAGLPTTPAERGRSGRTGWTCW